MTDSYLLFILLVFGISILSAGLVFLIIKNEERKDDVKHQKNKQTIRFLKKYMEYQSKKDK